MVTKKKTFHIIIVQLNSSSSFLLGVTEYYFLDSMSYDCYVAICKPLHYPVIMNSKVCYQLVFSSWVTGYLIIFSPFIMGLQLDFCASKVIDHFMCEISPILQISCTDTCVLELMSFILTMVTPGVTLVLVILSYAYIIKIILKFPSAQQRPKGFSTCTSHMTIVSLTYGSCIFMYDKPSAREPVTASKDVALLYTSVTPLLNPFIYTLRNQQVKEFFWDRLQKCCVFQKSIYLKANSHNIITTTTTTKYVSCICSGHIFLLYYFFHRGHSLQESYSTASPSYFILSNENISPCYNNLLFQVCNSSFRYHLLMASVSQSVQSLSPVQLFVTP